MLLRKFQRVIGTEFLIIRVLFGSVVFKAGVMLKGFLFIFIFLFFIYHKQLFYCMEIATTKEDDKYFQ